ncbi:DinB family protein [Nigerium massiliense]|uniref:DinB family protein n=1 Tax=Nigerium massiliense TaxID=1522317 RepID=UPI00058EF8CA|nr:DinB family protein [Nigerium massiliense]
MTGQPNDAIETDEHGRPEPPLSAGEVATLLGFLDYQRATLEWKTRGLDDAQLRRPLPPTSMTLGGLLSHMSYVEDNWFTDAVSEAAPSEPWASTDWKADVDADWHRAHELPGDQLRAEWQRAVEASRAVVAAELKHPDGLDRTHPAWGGRAQVSLRWVLVHMIEEYARHNGHADLLRESVDGETGE